MPLNNLCRADRALPLNRKERYYTGTVLPGMIWADGPQRFLAAIGEPRAAVDLDPGTTNVQFFTEYDLQDAVAHDQAARHLPTPPATETPDVVLYVEGVDGAPGLLVVVEAKMFSRPVPGELMAQVRRQRTAVIDYLRGRMAPFRDVQVALLPSALADAAIRSTIAASPGLRLVTWEDSATAYADVPGARYWTGVLRVACDRYGDFCSVGPKQKEARMSGLEICRRLRARTFEFGFVGREKGLATLVQEDIPQGTWQKRQYSVLGADECPRARYFPVWQFLAAVERSLDDPSLG